MPYVITGRCRREKDPACVRACATECIYGPDISGLRYVEPEECIDCAVCLFECPAGAIFEEANVPPRMRRWIHLNAMRAAFYKKGNGMATVFKTNRAGMHMAAPQALVAPPSELQLGLEGFEYADLYRPERLATLTRMFHQRVAARDPELWSRFETYQSGQAVEAAERSDLLKSMAGQLSSFIADLFRLEPGNREFARSAQEAEIVHRFKREFVMRRALKKHRDATPDEAPAPDARLQWILEEAIDPELALATTVDALLQEEARYPKGSVPPALSEQLELYECWVATAAALAREHGLFADWISLHAPEERPEPTGLVELLRNDRLSPPVLEGPAWRMRRRDGFALTDRRWSTRRVLDHVHYCVLCQEREKDSCARGYPLPRSDGQFGRNELGVPLNGCPLAERIGEAHTLRREGDAVGALALVMLDNPMCPGTGHRICNDCMKSCIYQKQEPVNIPQIETNTLWEVLQLPWGVEVYGLLTRWNPLNVERPQTLPYNGVNVLVDGLGPAGYTLSQWLLNEGFGVVGVDGLKIEPLPKDLLWDKDLPPRPVKHFSELQEDLGERISGGFGGVAEYGITVRWDKNFLKLIYLTLMRRKTFRAYGGIRFGGTMTLDDAWKAGFQHVAIAAGAGRPTVLSIKNNLLPGIGGASDFLMGLQLSGAFKKASIANLTLRMPVVVVGGGLTAVDACTEALAYYPVQVEKTLSLYEQLAAEMGEEKLLATLSEEDRAILAEQLEHGRAIRAERERARLAGEKPNFLPLLQSWGGATLCYRKRIQDAPAYRVNHEEIQSFLEEGVRILECVEPNEAVPDRWGRLGSVIFDVLQESESGIWKESGETVTLPAGTLLVAAGTTPNIVYEKEHGGTFELDAGGKFFQPHRLENGRLVPAAGTRDDPGFFTSYEQDGRYVTFYGDNHPAFAGSVVKAMASARTGYKQVADLFPHRADAPTRKERRDRWRAWQSFTGDLDKILVARVDSVIRLTRNIVEIAIHAPYQAANFQPGQFYRLQNYETTAPVVDGRRLQTEGIALTGAWVDKRAGIVGLIALEVGASSRLCATLREGEPIVLMGPTGAPTHIPEGEQVVLAGGGLGNAVMFSLAGAIRANGNRVLYFGAYKSRDDVFHQDEIEASADQVIWSVDAGELIEPRRPQDLTFQGNVVQAMAAYDRGELGEQLIPLSSVDRLIAIGSAGMMAAVARSRHEVLAGRLNPQHLALASVNSPMQCMMKEVCGHCLQKHVDPETGAEMVVFSCFNQDQPMDEVDWKNLNDRLRQNSLAEKLTTLWLDSVFRRHPDLVHA